MKALVVAGIVLLVLGLALLVVPVPKRERHGVEIGGVSLGVETTTRETLHPAIGALLIAGGAALMYAGRSRRRQA